MIKSIMMIFKGILIGIGKIIPGVSGAVIAISLNIYDKGIKAINNYFEDVKSNSRFLFLTGTGILIGIFMFSKIIMYLLSEYYLVTMLSFIGLILGGINNIKKKVNFQNKKNTIILIITIITVLLIDNISMSNKSNYNYLVAILLGFLEALTTIVPGISGTAILMCIGYYNLVMTSISSIDINFLLPFMIGIIFGGVLLVKLINYLFTNYDEQVYSFILGLTISSVILMLIMTTKSIYNIGEVLVGLTLLVIGYNISKIMEK